MSKAKSKKGAVGFARPDGRMVLRLDQTGKPLRGSDARMAPRQAFQVLTAKRPEGVRWPFYVRTEDGGGGMADYILALGTFLRVGPSVVPPLLGDGTLTDDSQAMLADRLPGGHALPLLLRVRVLDASVTTAHASLHGFKLLGLTQHRCYASNNDFWVVEIVTLSVTLGVLHAASGGSRTFTLRLAAEKVFDSEENQKGVELPRSGAKDERGMLLSELLGSINLVFGFANDQVAGIASDKLKALASNVGAISNAEFAALFRAAKNGI